MIAAGDFVDRAHERGYDFYTGVPCSYLTALIDCVLDDPRADCVGAASEGEAVAIAAGAWLAGREPVVYCQNSGLGNAVNPLTSLNEPFRIPVLLLVTWRGEPGTRDEPQHALMGAITPELVALMGIAHARFPGDAGALCALLDEARERAAEHARPTALIVSRDAFATGAAPAHDARRAPAPHAPGVRCDVRRGGARPVRAAVLERVLALVPDDAAVVATTGKCGRELFTLADREQHFYQVGSMGCATGIALGIALNTPRRVVVLDGDGAALMKMGTLATAGAYAPRNLVHVLLDNAAHDSTGGQPTVSPAIDFAGVALACGYRAAYACDDADGFASAFAGALARSGPSLIHVRIAPGSLGELGRPTIAPHEVARRFKTFVTGKAVRSPT